MRLVNAVRDLGVVENGDLVEGVAENVTVLPKTTGAEEVGSAAPSAF